MGNQQQWLEWVKKLPVWITGIVSFTTAIVGFAHLLQGDHYLGITILGLVVVAILLFFCLYLIFAKTPPLVEGGKGVYRFEKHRPWAFAGIGLVVGLVCAVFVFEQSRLFVTFAFVGTPTPTTTSTQIPINSSTPTLTVPTLMLTATCPYQVDTDANTILALIHAESEAVKRKDIFIIQTIFAEDAIIEDGVSGEKRSDPVNFYKQRFAEATYTDVAFFDIQPVGPGITEDTAWFTCASRGRFVMVGGRSYSYNNPSCSNHWTFGRDNSGCWVITRYTFNACHLPFPP